MTRGVSYSRRWLAFSLTWVGAACAMALFRHQMAGESLERIRGAADREGTLSRQIAERSDSEDSNLIALRARIGRFRKQLGSADSWDLLVRQFGGSWTAEAGPRDDRADYSLQVGTFVRISPAVSDWPEIVRAVGLAEHIPGVGIAELEMRSSGNRDHRSMDLVKFVVAIRCRRPGSAR